MTIKPFVVTVLLAFAGVLSLSAQTIRKGTQVSVESNLVSGKPYLLYYVGNKTGCYVKAKDNSFQIDEADKTISDEAVYFF